jgi:hypothetical protein
MSHRTAIVLVTLCLLSALNAGALILNLSQPARAAVRGMSYQDLLRDADFVAISYFPAARVRMAVINWAVVWLEMTACVLSSR